MIKGKTWSRGSNSRLPFGVNMNLNLSVSIEVLHDDFPLYDMI